MTKKQAIDLIVAALCCENGKCIMCPYNTDKQKCVSFTTNSINQAFVKIYPHLINMKLNDIVITDEFKKTMPRKEKMDKCRCTYEKYGQPSKKIVVDHKNRLVDGYVQYLVFKENNVEDVIVNKLENPKDNTSRVHKDYKNHLTTYIYGIHPNDTKKQERIWRVPNSWKGWENDILPGDRIMVNTMYGLKPIIVTRIEWLETCPVEYKVKKVAKKITV